MNADPRKLAARAALAPVFWFACHCLDWMPLREMTAAAVVLLSRPFGLAADRIGADVIAAGGERFQFPAGCTLIDFFCAAIPLVWDFTLPIARNVGRLAAGLTLLTALNLVRQVAGLIAYCHGVPWWLAHEVPGGFAHFAVFLAVVRVLLPDLTRVDHRDHDLCLRPPPQ